MHRVRYTNTYMYMFYMHIGDGLRVPTQFRERDVGPCECCIPPGLDGTAPIESGLQPYVSHVHI
jgi:hypothetical protein